MASSLRGNCVLGLLGTFAALVIGCDSSARSAPPPPIKQGYVWRRDAVLYLDTTSREVVGWFPLGAKVDYQETSGQWIRVIRTSRWSWSEKSPNGQGYAFLDSLGLRPDSVRSTSYRHAWATVPVYSDTAMKRVKYRLRPRDSVLTYWGDREPGRAGVVRERPGPVFALDTIGFVREGDADLRFTAMPRFPGACGGRKLEVYKELGEPDRKLEYGSTTGYRSESWIYGQSVVTFRWYSGGYGCEVSALSGD